MTEKDNLPVQATVTEPVVPPQEPGVRPTEEPAEDEFDKDRALRTIKAQREEAKELKARLKKLEALEADDAKRKEAEMTELQRAQKRADEAEAKAKKLEAETLRMKVANTAGLPPELAERLQGDTEDEMKADAEKLAALLPKSEKHVTNKVTNPAGGPVQETDAQKRARLLGGNVDPWKVMGSKEKGGGVVMSIEKD